MKKNFWIIGLLISSTVWADQAPVTPPLPRAKKGATHAAAKPAPLPELKSVPLVPGPAVVAVSPLSRVNVRGQAKLNSEIITHLTNGEPVTVVEEVHLARSGANEPSAWAKIVLPESVHVWVKGSFIDQTNMTVKPKTLNMRSGGGENFSVLGTLAQGDAIKEVSRKGDWIEIENPGKVNAYIAAPYLRQESVVAATTTTIETPTSTTPVTDMPVVATTTTDTPVVAAAGTNDIVSATTGEIVPAVTPPVIDEPPPPPRIVAREGVVRGTFSIQAPTKYELISAETKKVINYLHTTSPDLDLSRYKGLHIIVTGEEGLDYRWKNTPVITIQRIQVLD